MFRTYELLMYGGLLSASLWLGTQVHAQDAGAKAPDPFAASARQEAQFGTESPTASSTEDVNRRRVIDQLRLAREKLQHGEREEALRLTARASAMAQQWKITFAPNELSPQKLIAEIRSSPAVPAGTSMARKSGPTESPSMIIQTGALTAVNAETGEAVQAQREMVQGLLRQAQQEIAAGQLQSAQAKIEQAQTIDTTYGVFDLRPEHLMVELARHQPALAEGPSATLAAMTAPTAKEAAPQRAPAAAPGIASQKAQAVQLVMNARAAMQRGQFDEARELALEAQAKNVTWDLLEEGPDMVLADLERATRKQMIVGTQNGGPAQDAQRQRTAALELLKEARTALSNNQMELAQTKATEAQSLNASFALFDDRPDLVLQEVRMLQARNVMEPRSQAIAQAPPKAQTPAVPAGAASQSQKKQQASALLHQAREAMRGGDVATAQQLIAQAESYDVAFGLFEDHPEVVREDLNRLVAANQNKPQQSLASSAPVSSQSGSQGQSRETMKSQAMQLLQSARQDLNAGRVAEARAKASQASTFDVAYDLFEDSPERLLSELESASSRSVAATSPSRAPAGSAMGSDNLKDQARSLLADARNDLRAGRVDAARQKALQASTIDVTYDLFEDSPERILVDVESAGSRSQNLAMTSAEEANIAATGLDLTSGPRTVSATAAAPRDKMVVNSSGLSAQEMYDRGVDALRTGNREAAYESFLQAYHSGEKLDNYRQQQLQDKLRELSPRRRTIQTASNEVASSERLDAVAEQRSQQFDKVRTECLNAIFRAEKIRDKQPEAAIALLNQTLSNIQAADLNADQVASLTAWVKSSRSSIESYMAQQAPVIELERRNTETKDLIERQIQTRVRVEQELADLVQKFNELMEQKRFAEADAVAKQAAALDAENPAVVNMGLKSKFAMRIDRNEKLKDAKEVSFWEQLQAVEEAAVNPVARDDMPIAYPENWEELKKKRQKMPADAREHTDAEMRVRRSLSQPVSLHFNNAPLSDVLKYVADTQGINVMVDESGLLEESVATSNPISINVDGIQLKSALNLILEPLNLGYTIENEVLNVTSRMRKHGELSVTVYQVADLVVPLGNTPKTSRLTPGTGYGGDAPSTMVPNGMNSISAHPAGNPGFAQVPASPMGGMTGMMGGQRGQTLTGPASSGEGFEALHQLITSTVSPESWQEMNGSGSINQHDSTLSLVIRQTQKVHQEIADLLDQLRRLQDLQVTIEVRFITVSDQFFEQIGIDFDFNLNDTVGNSGVQNDFSPMRPFGSTDPIFGGAGGSSSSSSGSGGSGGSGGSSGSSGTTTSLAPFGTGPTLNMQDHDSWPSRTVVGLLNNTQTFSPTLDVPFRQGSFDLAAPSFGGFDPNAGISFGMAILSDIEAFMFVRAAQGDRRSNVMFAPKVTLYNGQMATMSSNTSRPFVISLTPVASAFNIGYQPDIQFIDDGTTLTVRAVVSADRRYVKLAVLPNFQNVTDVATFSFLSAGSSSNSGNGTGGGGGIGGGNNGTGGNSGGGGTGIGGGSGGNNSSSAAGTITLQQPIVASVNVDTVVSVPDGGTVLLGGLKTLREGRNMAGVPILNKIPYISRLFKNTGVGRETSSVMLMVTPRIIIQEEQEQLLGIPQ